MDTFQREIELIPKFKALKAAVLIRLACGKKIAQVARDLEISRTTIHRLLKDPEFKLAILEEQRYLTSLGVIEDRCLAYRRKVLKTVIRTFKKMEGGPTLLRKFEKKLDHIDHLTGMDQQP